MRIVFSDRSLPYIEHVRLWPAAENGASATSPCGESHTIRVFIFDLNGNAGIHSRPKQVAVEVSNVMVIPFDGGVLELTESDIWSAKGFDTPDLMAAQQSLATLTLTVHSAYACSQRYPAVLPSWTTLITRRTPAAVD